jgi:hypothetical protein
LQAFDGDERGFERRSQDEDIVTSGVNEPGPTGLPARSDRNTSCKESKTQVPLSMSPWMKSLFSAQQIENQYHSHKADQADRECRRECSNWAWCRHSCICGRIRGRLDSVVAESLCEWYWI